MSRIAIFHSGLHRHAFVDDALFVVGGVGLGDGGEQGLCVLVLGAFDDFFARAVLDDLALVHDGDAVADVLDDGHVVRDEEVGESEVVTKVGEEVEDL